jgi:hypothetical protein
VLFAYWTAAEREEANVVFPVDPAIGVKFSLVLENGRPAVSFANA